MRYCIDSSAFIEAWTRSYPRDVFPNLWSQLERIADGNVLATCTDVLRELERQDDGLAQWVRSQPNFVRELTEETQQEVKRIVAEFPIVQPNTSRNQADPFVIAMARVEGRKVVSQEAPTNKPGKPKIPDVCQALGVDHLNLLSLIRELKIRG